MYKQCTLHNPVNAQWHAGRPHSSQPQGSLKWSDVCVCVLVSTYMICVSMMCMYLYIYDVSLCIYLYVYDMYLCASLCVCVYICVYMMCVSVCISVCTQCICLYMMWEGHACATARMWKSEELVLFFLQIEQTSSGLYGEGFSPTEPSHQSRTATFVFTMFTSDKKYINHNEDLLLTWCSQVNQFCFTVPPQLEIVIQCFFLGMFEPSLPSALHSIFVKHRGFLVLSFTGSLTMVNLSVLSHTCLMDGLKLFF